MSRIALYLCALLFVLGNVEGFNLMRLLWDSDDVIEYREVEVIQWRQPVCILPIVDDLKKCFATLKSEIDQDELMKVTKIITTTTEMKIDDQPETKYYKKVLKTYVSPLIVGSLPYIAVESSETEVRGESLDGRPVLQMDAPSTTEGSNESVPSGQYFLMPGIEYPQEAEPIDHYATKVLDAPVMATLIADKCFPNINAPLCEEYNGPLKLDDKVLRKLDGNTNKPAMIYAIEEALRYKAEQQHEFLNKVRNATSNAVHSIGEKIHDGAEVINQKKSQVYEAIHDIFNKSHKDHFNQTKQFVMEHIHNAIDKSKQLKEATNEKVENFKQTVAEKIHNLVNATKTKQEAIGAFVYNKTKEIQEATNAKVENLKESMAEKVQNFVNTKETIEAFISNKTQGIHEVKSNKMEDFKEAVIEKIQDFINATKTKQEEIGAKVENFKESVAEKVENFKETLAEKVEGIKETVAEKVEDFKESVAEKVHHIVDMTKAKHEAIDSLKHNKTIIKDLKHSVVEKVQDFLNSTKTKQAAIGAIVYNKTKEFHDVTNEKIENFKESVAEKVHNIVNATKAKQEIINEKVENLKEKVDDLKDKIHHLVNKHESIQSANINRIQENDYPSETTTEGSPAETTQNSLEELQSESTTTGDKILNRRRRGLLCPSNKILLKLYNKQSYAPGPNKETLYIQRPMYVVESLVKHTSGYGPDGKKLEEHPIYVYKKPENSGLFHIFFSSVRPMALRRKIRQQIARRFSTTTQPPTTTEPSSTSRDPFSNLDIEKDVPYMATLAPKMTTPLPEARGPYYYSEILSTTTEPTTEVPVTETTEFAETSTEFVGTSTEFAETSTEFVETSTEFIETSTEFPETTTEFTTTSTETSTATQETVETKKSEIEDDETNVHVIEGQKSKNDLLKKHKLTKMQIAKLEAKHKFMTPMNFTIKMNPSSKKLSGRKINCTRRAVKTKPVIKLDVIS